MKLIIGLGNPGQKYEDTRHNAGFAALDFFKNNLSGFSDWQNSEKFKAEISEGEIGGSPSPNASGFGGINQKIILAKPQTFMNLSGQTAAALVNFYKMEISEIIVLHDDLALPLGQIRLSQNSASAGHNGVQSIIENLGSQNFSRIRIGIKPAKSSFLTRFFKTPAEKFVLQKFSENEKKELSKVIEKTNEALKTVIVENLQSAMNKFN